MTTQNKRYLITSALPYVNGIKHLGNLVGSMLPADVYARFLRQRGHEVLFICGTDEHGTPAEIAAAEAGQNTQEYCDRMYAIQKDIYERFSLSFDHFGRSSNPSNHRMTQEIFLALKEAGFIDERYIEQFYSPKDERFLPDRYVKGTCPYCNYPKARGDQCDGCGKLLDPFELINPYSSLSNDDHLERRRSHHLFLTLSKMEEPLRTWIEQKKDWPPMTKGIALKWLNEGLQDRCITRDLHWGIPVPGYPGKVFYVWFDAPIGYIGITQDAVGDAWVDWWKDPNVHYTQFMAKDNVPFHAIFFPAMLMASGCEIHLVDMLKSMSWLTFEGGKFSTSEHTGIFLDKALSLYPSDYWRYYLMAHIPETDDSDFVMDHFIHTINKDLADVLGNFVNRVIKLALKFSDGVIEYYPLVPHLNEAVTKVEAAWEEDLYRLHFRSAMQHLRQLWTIGNTYITEEEPWKVYKTDPERARKCLSHCCLLIQKFAHLSAPVIPDIAHHMLQRIEALPDQQGWRVHDHGVLCQKIEPPHNETGA